MVGYIYKITNTQTNQNYIGQTINIARRYREHFFGLLGIMHMITQSSKLPGINMEKLILRLIIEFSQKFPRIGLMNWNVNISKNMMDYLMALILCQVVGNHRYGKKCRMMTS